MSVYPPDSTNHHAETAVNISDLSLARQRAIAFIRTEQGEEDALPVQVFNPNRPDRTIFSSAYAALALSADTSPASLALRQRLVRFILSQREWPGVWRYWGKPSLVPCDLDDSSLAPVVLQSHGVSCIRTDWLFYLHRLPAGMFYAWMMAGNVKTLRPLYWLLILRDLTPARLYFRFFGPWKRAGLSNCHQYHVISNTHIVQYLGDTPQSAPAVDWIIDTLRQQQEQQRELYYRDPEFLYLGMGRAYSNGLKRFGSVGELIGQRVQARATPAGKIGSSAFTTAAAVAALLHFGCWDPLVDRAVAWLIDHQDEEGGWPAAPLDYAGPPPCETYWGSRALTTAVVVEALALYGALNRSPRPA